MASRKKDPVKLIRFKEPVNVKPNWEYLMETY